MKHKKSHERSSSKKETKVIAKKKSSNTMNSKEKRMLNTLVINDDVLKNIKLSDNEDEQDQLIFHCKNITSLQRK